MAGGKDLITRIKGNEAPEIVFIFGKAEFKKREIVDAYKEKVKQQSPFAEIQFFYLSKEKGLETNTLEEVADYISGGSLFGSAGLIVINVDEKLADKVEALRNSFLSLAGDKYVILWIMIDRLRGKAYDFATELKKQLKGKVEIVDATFSRRRDLIYWIKNFCQNKGLELQQYALQYLLEVSGEDINFLHQILLNVSHYLLDKERKIVDEDVINSVVFRGAEQSIFSLGDSLGTRNFSRALEVLNNLMMYGVHPLVIFVYMKNFYKQLFAVKSGDSALTEGINQFLVMKYKRFSVNYSFSSFAPIFRSLLKAELALRKSGLEELFVLELLLFELRRVDQVKQEQEVTI